MSIYLYHIFSWASDANEIEKIGREIDCLLATLRVSFTIIKSYYGINYAVARCQ
jgi:hypothetical protein